VELTEREPIDSDGQNWKRSKDQRDSLGDSTKGHHETNRRWMGAAASGNNLSLLELTAEGVTRVASP
jgi:hypothetical protein